MKNCTSASWMSSAAFSASAYFWVWAGSWSSRLKVGGLDAEPCIWGVPDGETEEVDWLGPLKGRWET